MRNWVKSAALLRALLSAIRNPDSRICAQLQVYASRRGSRQLAASLYSVQIDFESASIVLADPEVHGKKRKAPSRPALLRFDFHDFHIRTPASLKRPGVPREREVSTHSQECLSLLARSPSSVAVSRNLHLVRMPLMRQISATKNQRGPPDFGAKKELGEPQVDVSR